MTILITINEYKNYSVFGFVLIILFSVLFLFSNVPFIGDLHSCECINLCTSILAFLNVVLIVFTNIDS